MPVVISSTKKQILNAARNFFRERGYAATSMREIAKEVGVEPASLYSHFKSKEAILQYICFHIADEFFEMQEPILNSVSNPIEKLKRLVTGHINVIIENLEASSVFFNEWCYLKKSELKKFAEMRERYERGFRNVILEGITSGDFRMMDVSFTVRLLFSVMNGIHEWYKISGKVTPDEAGEKMSEFILNGLAIK